MRVVIRSLWATLLALLGIVVLAVSWTTTAALKLAATALIMGGTAHPLSTPPDDPDGYIDGYLQNTINQFINKAAAVPTGTGLDPIGAVGDNDDVYAVITPEEFAPVFGTRTFDQSVAIGVANLRQCIVGGGCDYNGNAAIDPTPPALPPVVGDPTDVFGYSQSAVVASLVKRDVIEDPDHPPLDLSFFFLANPMKPNGGILARAAGLTIPFLGVTFYGATPTNSCEVGECFESVDVSAQYDGLGGDAAVGLTNVLAVVNAAMGYALLHGNLQNGTFDDAEYQGSHGDTDYYLIPTPVLPLLMPFEPVVPSPIIKALDTVLRTLVEGGYAREINPGIPTPVELLPFHNPAQTLVNFVVAIPTAIDDAIADATGNPANRPLGTKPVTSPYGVGGPELPDPPAEDNLAEFAASARGSDHDEDVVDADEDAVDDDAVDAGDDDNVIADDDDKVIADGRDKEAADEAATDETDVDETTEQQTPESGTESENPLTADPVNDETTDDTTDSDDVGEQSAA